MLDKILFALFAAAAVASGHIGDPTFADGAPQAATGYVAGGEPAVPTLDRGRTGHVVLRDTDGLFRLNTRIDGVAVTMIVDTGASRTIVSRSAFAALGKPPAAGGGRIRTLSGDAHFSEADVERFEVGGRRLDTLTLAVMDTPGGVSVLGQDILARIGPMTLHGDRLSLR